jgi:antitoxin VapB
MLASNRGQAVRLPKAVAFPENVHEVEILKIGGSRMIVPKGKRGDDLFQNGPARLRGFHGRAQAAGGRGALALASDWR